MGKKIWKKIWYRLGFTFAPGVPFVTVPCGQSAVMWLEKGATKPSVESTESRYLMELLIWIAGTKGPDVQILNVNNCPESTKRAQRICRECWLFATCA